MEKSDNNYAENIGLVHKKLIAQVIGVREFCTAIWR